MDGDVFKRRLLCAAVAAVVAAAALAGRWAYLQVARFAHFAEQSNANLITVLPESPARGRILDRNGEILADNAPQYTLSVASDAAGAVLARIDELRGAVGLSDAAIARLRSAAQSRIYKGEIVIKGALSEGEVAAFIAAQHRFPEVVLDARLTRRYPLHDAAAHVVGHVGRITDDDLARVRAAGRGKLYRGARHIGKTGVESVYERRLHGRPGLLEARVDAHGRVLQTHELKAPVAGRDIRLALDIRLQRFAEELLRDKRGAVAAIRVDTGEVLALASSPRFDLNQFAAGLDAESWGALRDSEAKPLIHRAIYGQYAPGSTIKPFLALAALRRGWRDSDYTYRSVGYFQLGGDIRFHDWKEGGHGEVDLTKSIVRSVNTFYYQLAHDVGIDEMARGLSVFGFGALTGVDLDNEKSGVLPSRAWKRERSDDPWFPGDTVTAGVGQGYWQTTPLQLARAMAVIANGGRLLRPRLLLDAESESESEFFHSAHLDVVRSALAQVTRPGGTAFSVGKDCPYGIAGKTGTAQVASLQVDESGERIKNEDLPPHLRDHAWFVGYAPAAAPQIAVAALVENGGSGGRTAGPIVRGVMDKYLLEIVGWEIENQPPPDGQPLLDGQSPLDDQPLPDNRPPPDDRPPSPGRQAACWGVC